jgi:hypothetical protein
MVPPRSDRTPWAKPRRNAAGVRLYRKSAGDIGSRLDWIERAIDALLAAEAVRSPPRSEEVVTSGERRDLDHVPQLDTAGNFDGWLASGGNGSAVGDSDELRKALAGAPDQISDHPEYKQLKRKYRRAQAEALQLRDALAEAQRELATVKARTIGMQVSAMFRARLQQLLDQIPGIASRDARAKQRRNIEAIQGSSLFDAEWYLRIYPDVAAAGVDPVQHYIVTGWKEGRDPGPDFNSSGYIKANKDVANSGMNPLLHYIEFGIGEGRSIGVGLRPQLVRSAEVFDPPAPVIQFPLEPNAPVRWKRGHMLARTQNEPVTLGGHAIGLSRINEAVLRPELQRLEQLTGHTFSLAGTIDAGHELTDQIDLPLLSDAWFIRDATLRLHWNCRSAAPLVIRALQWSGPKGLLTIGEGLIAAPIELVDFELVTPLHPVLLVFATPEGVIVGGELLAFPSLCRGGLHYAERGALDRRRGTTGAQADLLACSRELEEAWARIVTGDTTPFLREIRVNVNGSDGTGSLLRKDVQEWLADILAIDIVGSDRSGAPSSRSEAYLTACVSPSQRSSAPTVRSMAPAQLVLPHDCMPTIQVLVASSDSEATADVARPASFISACDDTALGALAAVLPADCEFQSLEDVTEGRMFWPTLVGAVAPDDVIAAISREPREPAMSQLLQPSAQSVPIFREGTPPARITLLLEPSSWDEKTWAACLVGLRQQADAGLSEVCCHGRDAAFFVDEIERVLGVPTRAMPDWATAVEGGDAQFVLHVGNGVVLHDPRTIRHLAQLVADGNDGASCPLLAFSSHARDWTATIRSAGCIATPDGLADFAPEAPHFWNTQVPVARLPAEFWIVRATKLIGDPVRSARLVLSTQVSASHLAAQGDEGSVISANLETRTNSLQISRWLG